MAQVNPDSGIQPFWGNPAKSGYYQIFSQIWRMPMQLQCVQLITDKTNAADLSSYVFTISVHVTQTKNTKFIAVTQISSKNWQTVM